MRCVNNIAMPCIAHESPSGLGRPGGQAPKPLSGARGAGLNSTDEPEAIIAEVVMQLALTLSSNQVQDYTPQT